MVKTHIWGKIRACVEETAAELRDWLLAHDYNEVCEKRRFKIVRLLYFFDDKIKPLTMCGKYYCKPEETGVLQEGISCIREYDVNLWFYSKYGKTIAFDSGHLNYKGIDEEFKKIDIMQEDIKHIFLTHLDTDHAGGIDKSAVFGKRRPFHKDGEYNPFK